MEAMKMNLFVALLVVMMVAFSGIQQVAAAEAQVPAPSPTSDAFTFAPTFFTSLAALAFGLFF
ncbi:arabinogalactan protein 13-like [Pyrus communis]|uniref:arabinogalactan protein 13-like n=1 Tax=Pyrus communis TaxID=23211 RepID=UPI0035BEC30F